MRAIVRTKQFKPKPANPQADPRFKNVKNKANQTAKNLKNHPSAKQKSDEAAKAAKGPPNEKSAGAKANKVDSMKETKAETPPADSFLAVLRAEIEKVMPSNIEDADNFMDGGAEAEMKGAVKGNVKEQKDTASGDMQAATNAPPNEGGVPAKVAAPVPPDPNVPRPALNGGSAMPAPMPDSDISQKQTKADAQTAIKENRLDGKRGQNKHPAFEKVKSEKGTVERTADASPGKFRAGEKQTLGKAATQATIMGRTGMSSVVSVKNKSKSAVKSRQDAQKQKDELRRKAVTDHIEKIYNDTKKDVDANLNSLERDVMAIFDSGSSNAIAAFKRNTNRDIDKFYEERYSGVGGKLDWIADKFKDTPPRVKQIIQENLVKFTASMDALAVRVAGLVDKRLNKAKADIASGEAKIKAFVKTLPKDLQGVGKEAEKAMKSRFDEMREGIEAKKNDLAQKLAQKYKEAHDQANELAKKIEEENKGAFKKLADAIGEVIKIIMEFKDKLMALLAKAADAIELILDDPIGFLGNLIGAIKQGVNQFVGNIWTHLKAGFMKWLFGSLADAGIEIPTDLSLVSLFKMVMSVLGLTIPRLKAKAIKLLGPTAVAVITKLIEYVSALITGGPAKLWEQVKADVGDLKAMIIDAIQDWLITTIIKQATIKLLSFFNPAGAFIQALIAIYNTVMFVIENASKIMAFVEAVINSVSSIAKGAIGTAANWIEQSLASMIPLLIGFLARLIGLGGLSKKVKEFIEKVQGKVDKAIDKVIGKIVNTVKKLGLSALQAGVPKDPKERLKLGKQAALSAVNRFAKRPVTGAILKPLLGVIKTRYGFNKLDVVSKNGKWRVIGAINPSFDDESQALTPESLAPGSGKTLFLGEGNFSFSLSVAVKTKLGSKLIATDYVVQERVGLKEAKEVPEDQLKPEMKAAPDPQAGRSKLAKENIEKLKSSGVDVQLQVDAMDAGKYPSGNLDVIVFNHPFVVSKSESGTPSLGGETENIELIKAFLAAAKQRISEGGKIVLISSKFRLQRWKLDEIANQLNLEQKVMSFSSTSFVGYKHEKTLSTGSAKTVKEKKQFAIIFTIKTSVSK